MIFYDNLTNKFAREFYKEANVNISKAFFLSFLLQTNATN